MHATLQLIHVVAGVIVVLEALNKLERTAPFARGLSIHTRVVDGLKALAWFLLALGAGGAVATPVLQAFGLPPNSLVHISHTQPTLAETAMLAGFAILIIRTRVKEG